MFSYNYEFINYLLCRLQQFVDMVATQLGLEFQLARSMATHLSFRGRRKCVQCPQMMQLNLDHIQWFCHSLTSTRLCWRKFSVDIVSLARILWHCCQQQSLATLDRHTTCSSSWSEESERMMTIASYRRIMNAASCRLLQHFVLSGLCHSVVELLVCKTCSCCSLKWFNCGLHSSRSYAVEPYAVMTSHYVYCKHDSCDHVLSINLDQVSIIFALL